MFGRIPEKFLHITRWGLTLGWLVLIASLFFDPVSAQLTAPNQTFAAKEDCFQFQGNCLPLTPYPMGARIFWGMVLPVSVLTLLIFGHEAWRRICPLSFLSQIPRSLGWQRKRTVSETSWLGRNALSLQWGLLFLGLNVRLLLVNSDRLLLGLFLLLTISTAITIGFLYDGKTWCNYFCPMAPVQMVYSEPGGLLGSEAHTAPPKTITQSMCRTVDRNGQEKSACVACKVGCIDVDAESAYWEGIHQPDRKLLYYGYLGLVIGFYLYFWLYSGSWSFLSRGVWNETNQLATLMSPGFFIAGRAIPIPKLIAVPLTLTSASGATYGLGLWAEKQVKRANKRRGYPLSTDQVQSRLFAITTLIAFNLLFFMGVRPTLGYLPLLMQQILSWIAILASSLWVAKTWQRSAQRYHRERDAHLLRRQLNKLEIDFQQSLEGRSLDDLNPDELYALAQVLPGFSQDYRLQAYRGILREAFEQQTISPIRSLKAFQPMRQSLDVSEEAHWVVLNQLQLEAPNLFSREHWQGQEQDTTVYRPANRPAHRPANRSSSPPVSSTQATLYRPSNPNSLSNLRSHEATHRTAPDADATVVKPTDDKTVVKPTDDSTVVEPEEQK